MTNTTIGFIMNKVTDNKAIKTFRRKEYYDEWNHNLLTLTNSQTNLLLSLVDERNTMMKVTSTEITKQSRRHITSQICRRKEYFDKWILSLE